MNGLFWILLGLSLGFAVVEMSATFLVAERWRNYGIVDAVWSGGFAVIALLAFTWVNLSDLPAALRSSHSLLTAMVVLWSLRLALHLAVRIRSHHPVEDVRYAQLRSEWGAAVSQRMFGFYQLQGVLQAVLATPWLLVYANPGGAAAASGAAAWAGLGLWTAGWVGESLADRQLSRFRSDPANRGKVCQSGLWRYSRHPNYFFEWLIWLGYGVFALGTPWGWVGMVAPMLMAHFLINVTGIPMTEALSLKSKGEAYREYQRTTSAFIPWFPRRAAAGRTTASAPGR